MRLRDFFSPSAISLDLTVRSRPGAILSMVGLLEQPGPTAETLRDLLEKREHLGSTGVGRGIAIPHCRALVIPELRLAFGRAVTGIPYEAIDGLPVRYFFLIVAPPVEVSNTYLPVLGRLAQFAKAPDIPERLCLLKTVDDFFQLLDERGA